MPAEPTDQYMLDPDRAFAVLGHEVRTEILQTLAEEDEPLTFSDLYDHIGVDLNDSSRFNYHLSELVGHFVAKTTAGYELRPAGERVVEAILSGAITAAPTLDRTAIDYPCPRCGAPTEIEYTEEKVVQYCTGCSGIYGGTADPADGFRSEEGYLGYRPLPPAGLNSRTPLEVQEVAHTWNAAERLTAASGVCPRCSATCTESVDVCENHDDGVGLCETCGQRHAIQHVAECTNCVFSQRGSFVLALLSNTTLLSFLTDHGINPIAPSTAVATAFDEVTMDYEETLISTDPFGARFVFAAEDDRLALTVDDEFNVTEATRTTAVS